VENRDEESEPDKPEVLIAGIVEREYLGGDTGVAATVERAQLLHNLHNVSMAFQMYLADHDDIFPPAADIADIRWILDEYVAGQSVFLRPGRAEEVCVRWLAEPGRRLADLEDPVAYPIAVIDYPEGYYIVGYADGHTQMSAGPLPPELRARAGE
jgi:hypothetical protein